MCVNAGLEFGGTAPTLITVSTKAQAILDEIRTLPPQELETVCSGIHELDSRRQAWEAQQTRLRDMQARHAGRGLLNRLLQERSKERARG